MTCRDLAEQLIDYLGDDMPEEMKQAIRAHLQACPECVVFIETYQITIEVSRKLTPVEPPASLLEKLQRALEEK